MNIYDSQQYTSTRDKTIVLHKTHSIYVQLYDIDRYIIPAALIVVYAIIDGGII